MIVYAPMFSGMLTGGMTRERAAALPPDDFRSRNPEYKEPKLSKNLELVEKLKEIGARHGRGSRRSGHCLDAAQSRDHRRHRRLAQRKTGGRRDARRGAETQPAGN